MKIFGIIVWLIKDFLGVEYFNEVVFEDVFVFDDWFVGEEGGGWG